MAQQTHLVPGATVYGADGDKVGTMRTYGTNYIVVEKGFFFPTDYYIPVSAIETYSDNEVFLSVTKDDALNQGWDTEPIDSGMTATGYDVNATQDAAYQTETPGAMASQEDGSVTDSYESVRGDSTLRVPVHEEQLDATKRREAAGEVTINKRVVTDQETIEVPLTEERVRVDWRTPTDDTAADGAAFEEGSIEVPINREVVDINKRTVRTGELEVSKDIDEHMEQVSESVRREVVDVDESGVRTKSDTSGTSKNR
jgi:uncharacterized protein (TIGR02271 family)